MLEYMIPSVLIGGSLCIAFFLRLMGQPWVATSGKIKLWVNDIFSSECSQQIADWYSVSHFNHGILMVVVGRLAGLDFEVAFMLAVATGVVWEIVEHTEYVMTRFRSVTISQGYYGDTVINAVFDFLFMTTGFLLFWGTPWLYIGVMMIVLESAATFFSRDGLILSTIMVLHPIEKLRKWQAAPRQL